MGAKGRDTEYLQSGRKPPLLKHKPPSKIWRPLLAVFWTTKKGCIIHMPLTKSIGKKKHIDTHTTQGSVTKRKESNKVVWSLYAWIDNQNKF